MRKDGRLGGNGEAIDILNQTVGKGWGGLRTGEWLLTAREALLLVAAKRVSRNSLGGKSTSRGRGLGTVRNVGASKE